MNIDGIKNILPHREPMLLIDEVVIGEDNKAHAKYTVRGDEWFLQGHFPGKPVVPGVILCEMMAQACCVLVARDMSGYTPYFTGIDKVRFRNPVLPGDTLELICGLKREMHPFYFAEGAGHVNGRLCVNGELAFALK